MVRSFIWERCQSGRMSTLGKRVYLTVPRVRIPPSPPIFAFARASLLATIGCARFFEGGMRTRGAGFAQRTTGHPQDGRA